MGRGRWGQVLVTAGVVVLLVSLLVAGAGRELRDTDSVRSAAPDLLEVGSIRSAVTDELGRAIEDLYAPYPVDGSTLAIATERVVSNGYVVDDFQRAIGPAHRQWLDDGSMVVVLDPAVVTHASVTGLRDADLELAQAFPPGGVVEPGPILIPIDRTTSGLVDLGNLALLGVLGGLLLVGLGAAADAARQRTLRILARGLCAAGVALVLVALGLPLPVVREVHDGVAVMGALTHNRVTVLLVLAGVLVFVGLWLHASADRLVSGVTRQVERARAPSSAKPAERSAKLSRRHAGRHRNEAIDAFFSDEPTGSKRASSTAEVEDEVVLDTDEWAEPVPAGTGDAAGGSAAPTMPEDERAAALAAERREALERIDGTRSGYRTHLKR